MTRFHFSHIQTTLYFTWISALSMAYTKVLKWRYLSRFVLRNIITLKRFLSAKSRPYNVMRLPLLCFLQVTWHLWWLSKTSHLTWLSQHMHQITNLWKFCHRSCGGTMKENTFVVPTCVLLDPFKSLQVWSVLKYEWEITSFSKTFNTSEGAVFHNILFYQQPFIAHYQRSFCANNHFE